MLSETLRYELAPLNVRVITLVAGNVSSHMSSGVNGPPPAELPPTSRYKAIEKELQKNEEFADMDTTVFANEVVGAVVSGATGKVWKGGNMATVRWLMPSNGKRHGGEEVLGINISSFYHHCANARAR
jgi:1-acylglycerone phosphate reductase